MKGEIFSGRYLLYAGRSLRLPKSPRDARNLTTATLSAHCRRMSLWLSFDGMPHFLFKWPYQRILQEEAVNPRIGISYPDGFVSKDGKWLHLVYDDSLDKLSHYRARLPELPTPSAGNDGMPPQQKR